MFGKRGLSDVVSIVLIIIIVVAAVAGIWGFVSPVIKNTQVSRAVCLNAPIEIISCQKANFTLNYASSPGFNVAYRYSMDSGNGIRGVKNIDISLLMDGGKTLVQPEEGSFSQSDSSNIAFITEGSAKSAQVISTFVLDDGSEQTCDIPAKVCNNIVTGNTLIEETIIPEIVNNGSRGRHNIYVDTENVNLNILPREITQAIKLDVPNKVYYLSENISTSGTAINISVDNVTIDGNGMVLKGDDVGIDFGIIAEKRSNIVIKNIVVSDFNSGMWLSEGTNNTISGINASSNVNWGIFATRLKNSSISDINSNSNKYGMSLQDNCNYNVLSNINVSSNTDTGIYLIDSGYNNISNVNASSNPNTGISLGGFFAKYNNLTNLVVNNNGYAGLQLNSNYNTVTNVNAASNAWSGVSLTNAMYNILTNINSSYNLQHGVLVVSSSSYNNLTNLNVNSNKGNGIYLVSNSNNNKIVGISAMGNVYGLNLISSKSNSFTGVISGSIMSDVICDAQSTSNFGAGLSYTTGSCVWVG